MQHPTTTWDEWAQVVATFVETREREQLQCSSFPSWGWWAGALAASSHFQSNAGSCTQTSIPLITLLKPRGTHRQDILPIPSEASECALNSSLLKPEDMHSLHRGHPLIIRPWRPRGWYSRVPWDCNNQKDISLQLTTLEGYMDSRLKQPKSSHEKPIHLAWSFHHASGFTHT